MAGIPDKTIIVRKFDLCWALLTSIFTWANKWLKWLRMGSIRAFYRRIARPSSFPSFRIRGGGGHFGPPQWRRWLRPPPGRGLTMSLSVFWLIPDWFSMTSSELGYLNSKLMLRWDSHFNSHAKERDFVCAESTHTQTRKLYIDHLTTLCNTESG